ncbi:MULTISPECIES: accessory Sec system S-layer assembly protein [Bacillus]|uniref:Accessory Sec system S-layer assembly protein n=1 Tax=Bacillus cereus TaxID=1396 RepID=A0A2A8J9R5_BACCE|nr:MULTISPECIES: accessory Sec system S-layer assembly protein [Bacillus]PER28977.1 accessory Sec system S-layer assembly protein [Bacillus cereus]PGU00726.1 accessory Sec system S-layer assembly protein [Bacillus cereus]PGX13608.1 accessory Sec system S-layer assembly protein [Bacillus sp. AFS033286]
MLSFLKKGKKKGKDTVVSSSQLLGNVETATTSNKKIKSVLYFHPSWGGIELEQKYIYQFLHKDLQDLQENQVSLAGIEAELKNDTYYITSFIRNTVSKSIKFEKVTLQLLNKDEQICARKTFNLADLEAIPANTSMPWVFTFEKDTMTSAELSKEGWQLAFEFKPEHTLDLDPTWESQITNETKEQLQQLVANLTPPEEKEVNFFGLQTHRESNGDLHISILIRNGYNQNIRLDQMPLHISDASGDVIAKGNFKLDNFEVKANSSKPWTFTFNPNSILKDELDLSTWKAFIPQ